MTYRGPRDEQAPRGTGSKASHLTRVAPECSFALELHIASLPPVVLDVQSPSSENAVFRYGDEQCGSRKDGIDRRDALDDMDQLMDKSAFVMTQS